MESSERDGSLLDLLDCAREPIHVPGKIQPYGFLLALTPDWRVSQVSLNIADFTGREPEAWLGHPLATLMDPDAVHTLRNQVATLFGKDAVQRSFALPMFKGMPTFDVAIHLAGNAIIIEAEPAVTDEREAAAFVRAIIGRLKHSKGMPDFLRDGARHIQALTDFDRVMVYQFDPDGHGEVVAEALRGRQDSYMGLHYPASDIPSQARALYLRNSFRIIADVAAAPVPIVASSENGSEPLDQSLSVLRAVSPVHIEYLKNMGVAASLSISIIVNGQLWGLFACHHRSARLPSFAYRTASELFGEMYSMMLEGRLRREAAEHEARDRAVADLLVAEVQHNDRLLTDAKRLTELIFDTIPADGLCVHTQQSVSTFGDTLNETDCTAIVALVHERAPHRVFVTDELGAWLPDAEIDLGDIAGFIAIPLMSDPADYLLLFRSEQIRTVKWAGNPNKTVQISETGRPGPRHSFAAWAELVQGKCAPFRASEQHAAETIRVALMDSLVQASGQYRHTPTEFRSGQDMLIAELNHRVRNILALIRGLISQTRESAETPDGFIATLDERVQSLARAHDQITTDRWGPASLRDLLDTEAGAYLNASSARVAITGPNILVQPAAFTTLALVFHELMTNAAKYGALSASGTVSIEWRLDGEGALEINWSEQGGPAVSLPSRRGFGSTIIERSIPYDLGGAAVVKYLPGGFHARFKIPAQHLAGVSPIEALARPALPPTDLQLLAGLNVLLVEDSMIIAMDCAETLRSMGAKKVTTAASSAEALAAIEDQEIHFALLDFNLGQGTSSDIAQVLATRGIPFAFATGYGGTVPNSNHANAPVVGKPYGKAHLIPVLIGLGFE